MTKGYKHHTKAQTVALAEYVKKHYVISGLGDTEFSRQATAALQFPCSVHHIQEARDIWGIPNNNKVRPATASSDTSALLALIETLTERVARLERALIPTQHQLPIAGNMTFVRKEVQQ